MGRQQNLRVKSHSLNPVLISRVATASFPGKQEGGGAKELTKAVKALYQRQGSDRPDGWPKVYAERQGFLIFAKELY